MFKKSENAKLQEFLDSTLKEGVKFSKGVLLSFSKSAARQNIRSLQFGIREFTATVINTRLSLAYRDIHKNNICIINAKYKMICESISPLKECVAMHEMIVPISDGRAIKLNLITYATGDHTGYGAEKTFQQFAFNIARMVFTSAKFLVAMHAQFGVDITFPATYSELQKVLNKSYIVEIDERSTSPDDLEVSKMEEPTDMILNDFIGVDIIEKKRKEAENAKRQEYMIMPFRKGVNL